MFVYALILIFVQTSFHLYGYHQIMIAEYLIMPVRVKFSLYKYLNQCVDKHFAFNLLQRFFVKNYLVTSIFSLRD
jgi:hypothetical protein